MDEEVARRAEEQRIREGGADVDDGEKGEEKVIYLEK
jgi:hypothetical protein